MTTEETRAGSSCGTNGEPGPRKLGQTKARPQLTNAHSEGGRLYSKALMNPPKHPHLELAVVKRLSGGAPLSRSLALGYCRAESCIAVDDRVSVIGDFAVDGSTGEQSCVVAGASGLLIHHPDVLVKGSKVTTRGTQGDKTPQTSSLLSAKPSDDDFKRSSNAN
jgi:hypothetical protein